MSVHFCPVDGIIVLLYLDGNMYISRFVLCDGLYTIFLVTLMTAFLSHGAAMVLVFCN